MLLGNYSVIHKSPAKFLGGIGTICGTRGNFGKNGKLRGIQTHGGKQWGLPTGYYTGWMLPRTAGYIAAVNGTYGATLQSGSLVMGMNISALSDGLTTADADLKLIASTSGVAGGITFISSAVAGVVYGSGQSSGITTLSALLGAIQSLQGSATGITTAQTSTRASGIISGSITPFTDLSPQNLAAAVWSAMAALNDQAGTMGELLTLAGSGGVNYDTLAQKVWEYTTRELTASSGGLTLEEFIALKDE